MPSAVGIRELGKIEEEINKVVLKQKQLRDRRDILVMLEDFKKKAGGSAINKKLMRTDSEEHKKSHELEQIELELAALEAQEVKLQRQKDKIVYPKSQQSGVVIDHDAISKGRVFVLPPIPDFIIPPPPIPAPQVILDPKKLPASPSQTQCPSCHEFITTEIITKVGSVTWLACIMSALLGCVAGCCLIPFCISNFKDIVHRCPKCRSKIHTITKL